MSSWDVFNYKPPINNITESQKCEIGDITFANFQTAISLIRDYHIAKKTIVAKLMSYYIDQLLEKQKNE